MADEETDGGPVVLDPAILTGASEDGAAAKADQGGVGSGAQVSADDIARIEKRISDSRSQHDRDREEWRAEKSQLMDLLGNKGSQDDDRKTQEAIQEARDDLMKRFDDGELTGKELIGLLDGVAEQAREGALAETTSKMTKAEQDMAALKAELDAMRSDLDPAYVSHKDKVDAVVKAYGVTRQQAMAIVKDSGPSQPARPALAGSVGTHVVSDAGADGVDAKTMSIVAGLAQAVGGRAPTEAETQKLQKKWSKK